MKNKKYQKNQILGSFVNSQEISKHIFFLDYLFRFTESITTNCTQIIQNRTINVMGMDGQPDFQNSFVTLKSFFYQNPSFFI